MLEAVKEAGLVKEVGTDLQERVDGTDLQEREDGTGLPGRVDGTDLPIFHMDLEKNGENKNHQNALKTKSI